VRRAGTVICLCLEAAVAKRRTGPVWQAGIHSDAIAPHQGWPTRRLNAIRCIGHNLQARGRLLDTLVVQAVGLHLIHTQDSCQPAAGDFHQSRVIAG
jgi:hypothetical protein